MRIPLSVVSVYQVSIPRDFLSFRMKIPIEIFKKAEFSGGGPTKFSLLVVGMCIQIV